MNLQGGQMAIKSEKVGMDLLGGGPLDAGEEAKVYHERELRLIAAFRLRDAANRVATLVSMTASAQLRAELLAVYERLLDEERGLLVRSMNPEPAKSTRAAGARAAARR